MRKILHVIVQRTLLEKLGKNVPEIRPALGAYTTTRLGKCLLNYYPEVGVVVYAPSAGQIIWAMGTQRWTNVEQYCQESPSVAQA